MAESPATLLVVSHDRRLLETVCEKLWVVDDGAAVAVRRRLPRVARGGRRRLDRRGRARGGGEAAARRADAAGDDAGRGPAAATRRRRRAAAGGRPSADGRRRRRRSRAAGEPDEALEGRLSRSRRPRSTPS